MDNHTVMHDSEMRSLHHISQPPLIYTFIHPSTQNNQSHTQIIERNHSSFNNQSCIIQPPRTYLIVYFRRLDGEMGRDLLPVFRSLDNRSDGLQESRQYGLVGWIRERSRVTSCG